MDACTAVESKCERCNNGEPSGKRRGAIVHCLRDDAGRAIPGEFAPCPNWDSECRHAAEPSGLFVFAWKPVRCRNGKFRWLRWVQRHYPDRTYTLGDTAF